MPTITTLASGELETQVIVADKLGLHARPAALVAQVAQGFRADVRLLVAGQNVDAKSILDILSLAAGNGAMLKIRGNGPDARDAVTAVAQLFIARFKEEPDTLLAGEER